VLLPAAAAELLVLEALLKSATRVTTCKQQHSNRMSSVLPSQPTPLPNLLDWSAPQVAQQPQRVALT
jgi:hypothetical protein